MIQRCLARLANKIVTLRGPHATAFLFREQSMDCVGRILPISTGTAFRTYSNTTETKDEGERKLGEILQRRFPDASKIAVEDISGGCGSMYEIHIHSPEFAKMRTVAQHKLVTNALKEEVGKMHGLRIFTSVPE